MPEVRVQTCLFLSFLYLVFLKMLHERSPCAVHHALGGAGRARGVHDEERVRKRDLLKE
jgi:hypothetical protein